jgi:SAM-dependent methyltransferase
MASVWRWLISRQLRRPSGWFGRTVIAGRFRSLNVWINEATLEALDLALDDRVIEIGFGPGELLGAMLDRVPDGVVAGADFSRDMVSLCRRRFRGQIAAGRARVEQADVVSLPFDDAWFTKACTVNTVYFWPDLAAAFSEIGRVLAPGARLVVAFTPRSTMESFGVDRDVFTLRDPDEVQAALDGAGFAPSEVRAGAGPSGEFVSVVARKL